ncbi:MAG: rod shape-determining protein MreD [Pseudomonadales bacterium]|nr:rod shape-determining protein MreD [Pseudomonadales bacterium]
MEGKSNGRSFVVLSFLAAFILATIPLSATLDLWRPEWVLLVLLYWVIALPERYGLVFAWFTGLLVDFIEGGLLGQHAITFALSAFFALSLHQQFRMFSRVQQTLLVGMAIVIYEVIDITIQDISGNASFSFLVFLPVFTSAMLWPLIFSLLRGLRRRYRIE